MDFPVFKISFKDDSPESGFQFIALVDEPAIEKNYLFFKDQKLNFQIKDKDKQIISGPIMLADTPIYQRNKDMGEFYVVFEKQTLENLVQKYFRDGFIKNINIIVII